MAKFKFTETVPAGKVISAKLGVDAANPLSDADVGKFVKLAANDNYVLCAEGDEIEGVLLSVEPATIDGFAFGSVQIGGRKAVTLQGAVPVGTAVVCGTPVARGTALTAPALVKAGTAASQLGAAPYTYTERTPNTHIWRNITGAGTAGAEGLIERVNA